MEQLSQQQCMKGFRKQAVELVLTHQVLIAEAARRLSMSGKPPRNWVGRARRGQLTTLQNNRRPVTEGAPEIRTV